MEKRKGGFDSFTFDDYTITRDGDVINNRWNRKVKPQPNNKGYLRVQICGEFRFVHRLVAEKYIPNPYNKPQVNHIDGNKLNNSAENLEWVSNAENRRHAVENGLHIHGEKCPWSKLSENDVAFIREHTELNNGELGEMFNVAPATVYSVRNHKSWK